MADFEVGGDPMESRIDVSTTVTEWAAEGINMSDGGASERHKEQRSPTPSFATTLKEPETTTDTGEAGTVSGQSAKREHASQQDGRSETTVM